MFDLDKRALDRWITRDQPAPEAPFDDDPEEEPYSHCNTCGECIGLDEQGECYDCFMRANPRAVTR